MMGRGLLFAILFLIVTGCKNSDTVAEEIAEINIDLKVSRFDRDFASATPNDLQGLKDQYPYLFPVQYPDSVWTEKMGDSIQIQLLKEIDKEFGDFESERADLELLLKHIIYYFPKTQSPRIVTVSSDVDYNNRVILADSLLLIGLDNYLGPEHRFYQGINHYIAKELDKKYLSSDVASAFANKLVRPPADRSFLSQMIYYGKNLYLKDIWMPLSADTEKIHYSEEEMEWVKANEEQMWRYFIEKEYLYSTDQGLAPRFLDPAPFSKFRLELDSESPGRAGRYIGWMIVRSFMDKNELGVVEMLSLREDEIFKKSGYKPKN